MGWTDAVFKTLGYTVKWESISKLAQEMSLDLSAQQNPAKVLIEGWSTREV